MHPTAPARAVAALALSLAAVAPRAADAQQYFTMTAGQIGAGACTGSTGGEGLGHAGGYPTEYFFRAPFHCDVKIGTTAPVSAASAVGGIAPQSLMAAGSADWGTLKFYAEEHIQNWQNQGLTFPRAFAQVGFRDRITIVDPTRTGQQGMLTGQLHLTGTLYGHGDQGGARAQVSLIHNGVGTTLATHSAGQEPTNVIHVIDEILQASIPFTFGTPFDLGLFAYAVTSNRSEGGLNHLPGDAAADFRNTLRWLGATATTAGGAPVTGFTVASASGTGWLVGTTAVPEPSTVALVAGGLAALGVATRRRRAA